MTNKLSVFLVVASMLSPWLSAQKAPQQTLLALSKRDHTLSIVDPGSLKILAKVPAGNDPHEVVASTDGRRAYVSNYGFGAYNTITVIDLTEQKPLPQIDLGPLRGPHGLAFVGGKVWFTSEVAKAIGSYDPATAKLDWVLGTGQNRTHMIFVFDDMKRIVTTNTVSATVSIIEKSAGRAPGPPPGMPPGPNNPPGPPPSGPPGPSGGDWDETVVRVGNGSEGFDVSPDRREIWVGNAHDGTISIIDVASKSVTQTLAADVRGVNRVKFTPDGSRVLVSSLSAPDLVVLDARSRKEIKRIKLGRGAAGILMQPDGVRAFVACSPDNYVAVIDLKSLEITERINVGADPDGLAWAVKP